MPINESLSQAVFEIAWFTALIQALEWVATQLH